MHANIVPLAWDKCPRVHVPLKGRTNLAAAGDVLRVPALVEHAEVRTAEDQPGADIFAGEGFRGRPALLARVGARGV